LFGVWCLALAGLLLAALVCLFVLVCGLSAKYQIHKAESSTYGLYQSSKPWS
jgi:hypothetical protein